MQIVGGHIGQKPSYPYIFSRLKLSRAVLKLKYARTLTCKQDFFLKIILRSPVLKRSNFRLHITLCKFDKLKFPAPKNELCQI